MADAMTGANASASDPNQGMNEATPPAPEGLSEEARQQALDVRAAIGNEVRDTTSGLGEPPGPQVDQELAQRQYAFERSVTVEDIQRTNEVKGPGE